MDYLQFTFQEKPSPKRDELMAALTGMGFEGFEETPEELLAYAEKEADWLEEARQWLQEHQIPFTEVWLANRNWNAEWEAAFKPVVVDDFCYVRAGFHEPSGSYPHEIVITPKMSFGTGHHETTRLMMRAMQHLPLRGAAVLDFGAGTGVLAILAAQMGAAPVDAVENDPNAADNARENIVVNQCSTVEVITGSLEQVAHRQYNCILANINRNILLQYLGRFPEMLSADGDLLMSGLLVADRNLMVTEATANNLQLVAEKTDANWLMLHYRKAKMPLPL